MAATTTFDLGGIVDGFEHGLVFGKPEIERLIATNRDFMWNQDVAHAKFKRIDGEEPDTRWKDSPGVLWFALLPYDAKLREIFEANHRPDSWGGLVETPIVRRHGRREVLKTIVAASVSGPSFSDHAYA